MCVCLSTLYVCVRGGGVWRAWSLLWGVMRARGGGRNTTTLAAFVLAK